MAPEEGMIFLTLVWARHLPTLADQGPRKVNKLSKLIHLLSGRRCLDTIFPWSLPCIFPSLLPGWCFSLRVHTFDFPYSELVSLLAFRDQVLCYLCEGQHLPSTSAKQEVQWHLTVRTVGQVQTQAGLVSWAHPAGRKGGPVKEELWLTSQDSVVSSMGLECQWQGTNAQRFSFSPGGKTLGSFCKPRIVCAHWANKHWVFASDENASGPISVGRARSLHPIWIRFGHKWLKFFQWWLSLSIKLRLSQRSRNFNWKPYPVSSLPSWCDLSELQAPLNSLI